MTLPPSTPLALQDFKQSRMRYPGVKSFVVGMSLGGMMAAQVAASTTVHGAVLIAPAIVIDPRTASPTMVRYTAIKHFATTRRASANTSWLPLFRKKDLHGALHCQVLPTRRFGRHQARLLDARPGEGVLTKAGFGCAVQWCFCKPSPTSVTHYQLDEFYDDELIYHGKARARWGVNLLKEMIEVEHHNIQVRISKKLFALHAMCLFMLQTPHSTLLSIFGPSQKVTAPLLILQGSDDKVCNEEGNVERQTMRKERRPPPAVPAIF